MLTADQAAATALRGACSAVVVFDPAASSSFRRETAMDTPPFTVDEWLSQRTAM